MAEREVMLSAAELAERARAAGFDLCGFARAEPIPELHLRPWLAGGNAADMAWIGARAAERLEVQRVLPGARTVMALACGYHRPESEQSESPIARYARGRDYHYTLKERLTKLRKALEAAHPGLGTYGSVDTGPVMEKVWAARAGLGYVGNNGCLITPSLGSWVLLAVLLLDREVDAYAAGLTPDRCDRCNLCITECPTGALDGSKAVDARLCLSYLTIESRGPAPEHLRQAHGNNAFGCDLCQTVCPLNDSPVPTADPRFAPREAAQLDAVALADLSAEDYRRLTQGMPLVRAKYDGLRRNALYAIGSQRLARARPVVEKLTSDPSDLVREAAQWALRQIDR